MKVLKIKLNKAIKLKNALENSIDEDNLLIQQQNSIIEGNDRVIDINEIESLKDLKSEFLIELNLIIQGANLKKGKGEEVSNAYNVKKLSEIKRELLHLNKISTKDGVTLEDKQKVKYSAFLKFSDVTSRQKELLKEKETLQTKLTKFNENTDISISYDPQLKEIIESIGIEI